MHNYKKHFKADGSFVLNEYREDGKIRVIQEDNSCYMEFIKTNTPEDIAYIAPEPLPKETLITRLKSKITTKYNALIYADFEYPLNSGIMYAGDYQSMELLKEAVQMFSLLGSTPEGFQWWDVENIRRDTTFTDLVNMFINRGSNKEMCLVAAKDEKDALADLTVEQLLTYKV
jgi:hypothetical protein